MNIEHTKNVNVESDSREGYRRQLISLFLNEEHGTVDDVAIYYYYVEQLSNGTRIYLKRPTNLNKGVDFEVRVENVQFRYGKYGNIISTGNRPSHSDITDDLTKKINESFKESQKLLVLIQKVYQCKKVEYFEIQNINLASGYPAELILSVLKWLFIEQDITYWNRSGREMLYNGILELWGE